MSGPALYFGSSAGVRALLDAAQRYAPTKHPILILGDRGVGKTALARRIHELSGRPGPFVHQPVAWIPPNLEGPHLVGHARGAFTNAYETRPGQIESAHCGTLFLDELGLASPVVQQLLLQVLEQGSIRRVGEARDRPVDVRIIAATNADLEQLVAAERFRADLLDRFGYLILRVPGLADREDEILPLARAIVEREAAACGRAMPPALSTAVEECLLSAPWRGNIRELQAICRYAVLNAPPDGPIEMCDLPPEFIASLGSIGRRKGGPDGRAERARAAVARAGGDKAKAARLLGCSRQQLYRMLGVAGSALLLFSLAGRPADTSHLSHRTHRPPVARSATRLRQMR